MRMTGTEKSFQAWVNSKVKNAYFYRNTIRESDGRYSVTVPELNMQWVGDAKDAVEARILAVEHYEKRSKNPVTNDNTLFKYTSDFLQKLRWSNRAEAQAALSMITAYSKDFGNSAEERKLYREAATIIRRWIKDFATDQRGRARNPKARKKNPEIEIRELILFAENHEPLSNQFYSILKNLEKKAKKGTYDPVLATKLWKYWIDNAVKEYNFEFLTRKRSLVQNVFSVQDRKDAAVQVEAQWRDDVFRGDNPKRRATKNPKPTWEYETAIGIPVRGTLEKTSEGQGTDVTYFFRRETGELDVISGSRLKKIKRIDNPRKRKATRKKNPKSAYDGKGIHILFLSDGKKIKYVTQKIWKGKATWYGVDSKRDAYNFHSITSATKVANHVDLPQGWIIGISKRSEPVSHIKKIIQISFGKPLGKARRSNPVGPTQKQIDNAANLFREFTGDFPGGSQTVKLPVPKTGLVIGELDGVLYTTIRDGKTEKYQHDFKKSSRPHLIASSDGSSLHILGGDYEFTERGIEDR